MSNDHIADGNVESKADGIKPSVLSDLLDAIPTGWLDPLLTGKKAVIGQPPYCCEDIENLLRAIKKRMEGILLMASNVEISGSVSDPLN